MQLGPGVISPGTDLSWGLRTPETSHRRFVGANESRNESAFSRLSRSSSCQSANSRIA
jgi:hypothetical protein